MGWVDLGSKQSIDQFCISLGKMALKNDWQFKKWMVFVVALLGLLSGYPSCSRCVSDVGACDLSRNLGERRACMALKLKEKWAAVGQHDWMNRTVKQKCWLWLFVQVVPDTDDGSKSSALYSMSQRRHLWAVYYIIKLLKCSKKCCFGTGFSTKHAQPW